MIVMINGSFGVGKSTVAAALSRRLGDAMVYDPELVGELLRQLTEGVRSGQEETDDFQDIELWPALVVIVAEQLQRRYGLHLIVPITLDNAERLGAIRNGFAKFEKRVFHYCLTAPAAVVADRLAGRGDSNGEWTKRRAAECVERFVGDGFEVYVDTNHRPVEDVVSSICADLTQRCGTL